MALSLLDAQDEILSGQAKAEEFMRDFQAQWVGPTMKLQIKVMWALMPAETKDQLKLQNPQMFQEVTDFLKKDN